MNVNVNSIFEWKAEWAGIRMQLECASPIGSLLSKDRVNERLPVWWTLDERVVWLSARVDRDKSRQGAICAGVANRPREDEFAYRLRPIVDLESEIGSSRDN